MANSTIRIRESGIKDYRTRLRSYQTPLRRSPRFLPQINNNTPLIASNKQPINAINKTHFKSPPNLRNPTQISTPKKTRGRCLMKCRSEPLRSVANLQLSSSTNRPSSSCKTRVKISPHSVSQTQVLTPMTTLQGCSTKWPNESLRSVGNLQGSLRRSRRLSSLSSFVIAKESVESVSQRRQSLRLMGSAEVLEGKENVSFNGFSEEYCQSCRKEMIETLKKKRSSGRLMGSVKISEGKEIVGNGTDENCRIFRKECVEHVNERRRSSRLMGSVEVSEGRENVGSVCLHEEIYKGFAKESVKSVEEEMRSPQLMGTAKEKGREEYVGIDGLNDEKANNANLTVTEVKERRMLDKEKVTNDGHVNLKRKRGTICKRNIKCEKVDMGNCSDFGDWTRVQDAALQNAYLIAKPSPHFWKKVARMVPGKSAQECFDRVNGSLETPPHPQPRSRSKKTNPSPISSFSLSGSKPVQHSLPLVKPNSWKKSLAAQKTVRKLLRKHSTNDQNHEADHFSVFETSPVQFATDSPEGSRSMIRSPSWSHQKHSGGSSSTHKMPSRFKPLSPVSRLSAMSPEVLKRIKNMALHEKYVDQLHNREARRKFAAASKFGARVVKSGDEVKAGIVKAARSALMSEAKDVIFQFQHMQANSQFNYDNDDDCTDDDEDDDDEE